MILRARVLVALSGIGMVATALLTDLSLLEPSGHVAAAPVEHARDVRAGS